MLSPMIRTLWTSPARRAAAKPECRSGGHLYSDCGQRLQLALKVIGVADALLLALRKGILQRGDLGLQGIQPLIAAAGGAEQTQHGKGQYTDDPAHYSTSIISRF